MMEIYNKKIKPLIPSIILGVVGVCSLAVPVALMRSDIDRHALEVTGYNMSVYSRREGKPVEYPGEYGRLVGYTVDELDICHHVQIMPAGVNAWRHKVYMLGYYPELSGLKELLTKRDFYDDNRSIVEEMAFERLREESPLFAKFISDMNEFDISNDYWMAVGLDGDGFDAWACEYLSDIDSARLLKKE